jgi:hypothetical protein
VLDAANLPSSLLKKIKKRPETRFHVLHWHRVFGTKFRAWPACTIVAQQQHAPALD